MENILRKNREYLLQSISGGFFSQAATAIAAKCGQQATLAQFTKLLAKGDTDPAAVSTAFAMLRKDGPYANKAMRPATHLLCAILWTFFCRESPTITTVRFAADAANNGTLLRFGDMLLFQPRFKAHESFFLSSWAFISQLPVLPVCEQWKLWIDMASDNPEFSEASLFVVDDYKETLKSARNGVAAVLSSPLLRAVFPSTVQAGAALNARVTLLTQNKIDDSLAAVNGRTLGRAYAMDMYLSKVLATFLSSDADVSFIDGTTDAGGMLHYKHVNSDGTCNEFVLMEFFDTRLTPADQWLAQFKDGAAFAGRAQNLWAIAAFAFWDPTAKQYLFELPKPGVTSLLWPDVYDPAPYFLCVLLVKQASAVVTNSTSVVTSNSLSGVQKPRIVTASAYEVLIDAATTFADLPDTDKTTVKKAVVKALRQARGNVPWDKGFATTAPDDDTPVVVIPSPFEYGNNLLFSAVLVKEVYNLAETPGRRQSRTLAFKALGVVAGYLQSFGYLRAGLTVAAAVAAISTMNYSWFARCLGAYAFGSFFSDAAKAVGYIGKKAWGFLSPSKKFSGINTPPADVVVADAVEAFAKLPPDDKHDVKYAVLAILQQARPDVEWHKGFVTALLGGGLALKTPSPFAYGDMLLFTAVVVQEVQGVAQTSGTPEARATARRAVFALSDFVTSKVGLATVTALTGFALGVPPSLSLNLLFAHTEGTVITDALNAGRYVSRKARDFFTPSKTGK
jgi:hypothetical protein